jgi:2-dehydro-3-deoxyphosphogluconate aldolase / (4S)-4-hydroxy-2-oxoglutarate aldolase
MDIKEFERLPVMGILRGIDENMVEQLTECIVSSGLQTVEITMNTERATELIRKMVIKARGRLTIGAGTVLTVTQLEDAMKAGATFAVSPVIADDVTEYCFKNNIAVFPGALTPNEIYKAWNMGATMVKVFPAKAFGIGYFKEVKAPLNDIKLMATGGVTAENAHEFFLNGANAISFGASIFKPDWLKAGEYSKIEDAIKELIMGCKKAWQ